MAVQAGRTTGPSRPPLVPTRRRGETLEHAIFDALLDLLRRMTATINSPTGCALQSLLAEIDREGACARVVHERVLAPRKQMFLTALRRGVDRGEVRPDAVTLLVGR